MSACNCCEEPPRPTPLVIMQSRVGFSPYIGGGYRIYKKCEFSVAADSVVDRDSSSGPHIDTQNTERHQSFVGSAEYINGVIYYTIDSSSGSFSDVKVDSADPGSDYSHSGSGSISPTSGTTLPDWDWTGYGGGETNVFAAIQGTDPTVGNWPTTIFTDPLIYDVTLTPTTASASGSDSDTVFAFTYDESLNYFAEKSEPIPVSYKIKHGPTASCFLKVWLRKKITPAGGGSITYEDLDPYVWTGTGTPCLLNPEAPIDDLSNVIESEIFILPIPDDDVKEEIEIVKWSYLPAYEPDISDPGNPQPNGFPDPEWVP